MWKPWRVDGKSDIYFIISNEETEDTQESNNQLHLF